MSFLSERQFCCFTDAKLRVPPPQGKSLSVTGSSGIECLPCTQPPDHRGGQPPGCHPLSPLRKIAQRPRARATAGARRHFLPLDSSTPCPRLDAIKQGERREYPFSDEGFRFRGLGG